MRCGKRLLARILVIITLITMVLPGPAAFADNYPTIVVNTPVPYTVVGSDSVNVAGYVTDTASLKINGRSVTIGNTGFFSYRVDNLTTGTNTIRITATGASGLTTTSNVTVIYDSTDSPATISVTSPPSATTEWYNVNLDVAGSVYCKELTIYRSNVNGSQNWPLGEVSGNFSQTVTLLAGDNTIEIVAVKDGMTTTKKINIRYNDRGVGQPNIYNLLPATGTTLSTSSVVVSGTVYNTAANGLTVNNVPVAFDTRGNFHTTVTLQPGDNTIYVTVKPINGGPDFTKPIDITYSSEPIIVISSPLAGATVSLNSVAVTGRVFNTETGGFYVNGERVSFTTSDGSFTKTVSLQKGINSIEFEAYNGTLLTSKVLQVSYSVGAAITVTSPSDESTVYTNSVTIRGKLEFANFSALKVGDKATTIGTDGSFSQIVELKSGENEIKISATPNGLTPLEKILIINYNPVLGNKSVFNTIVADGDDVGAFADAIKVKLAENSLGLDTNLTISVEDPYDLEDNPPSQAAFLSPLFRLRWEDEHPTKPYKITLEYDSVVRENQAHKVTVLFYDEDEEEWVILGGTADAKGQTISVETDREGYFAAAMYFRTFDDVYGHWAQRDIEFLVSKGAISGVSSTKFKPESNVTRAEFVTFLVKSLGWLPYEPEKRSYSDLDDDHWAYGYIEAALRAGLVTGVSRNKFAPDRYITREEAGAMLARAANLKTLKDQEVTKVFSDFADAENVSLWARNELAATIKAKVLTGSDNGMFLPKSNTTRAQAAAMIARLVEVTGKSKSTTK